MEHEEGGWKKIHAVISVHDVSVLSFSVTDGHVHDAKEGRSILESVKNRILGIFGDKDYDSKDMFNAFSPNTVIPPGKNAFARSRGSPARAKVVRLIRRTSEKEWKDSVQYGKRWNVEIYFSGLKRTVGEAIKAVRPDYMVQEIALKVQHYNIMREMAHAYWIVQSTYGNYAKFSKTEIKNRFEVVAWISTWRRSKKFYSISALLRKNCNTSPGQPSNSQIKEIPSVI